MRVISPQLQTMLDLPSCQTQTTLDIILPSGQEYHFATKKLSAQGFQYTDDLRISQEIVNNIFTAIDRVSMSVQNVDIALASVIAAESFANAVGILGRYYSNKLDPSQTAWTELFRGQAAIRDIDAAAVSIEILNDLAAAGYVVANWSLGDTCQFVYKHAGTCGYVGGEAKCNKQRRSPDGCQGRANEHHFGGMEQPENPVPTPNTARLSLNYFNEATRWGGDGRRQIDTSQPLY